MADSIIIGIGFVLLTIIIIFVSLTIKEDIKIRKIDKKLKRTKEEIKYQDRLTRGRMGIENDLIKRKY